MGVMVKGVALTAVPACVFTVIKPDAALKFGIRTRLEELLTENRCGIPFSNTSVTFTKFVPFTPMMLPPRLGVPVPALGGANEEIVGGPPEVTVKMSQVAAPPN